MIKVQIYSIIGIAYASPFGSPSREPTYPLLDTVKILNTSGSIIKAKGNSSGQGGSGTGNSGSADPLVPARLWQGIEENNTITDHQISRGPKRF